MSLRWQRWALVAGAALGVYAVAGFIVVPWAAKREIARWGTEQLHRHAEVADIAFNPFTLRLEAAGLKLTEADGSPIAGIGRLSVRMQWRSLLPGAWRFDEVRIVEPSIDAVITKEGRFNLVEVAQAATGAPEQPSAGSAIPRLAIERLAVEHGRVGLQDRQAGYANVFAPLEFEVAGLSTLPDESDDHTFTAQWRNGGRLQWKGHATLDPMRASGELALEGVGLKELGVYVGSRTGIAIGSGRLAANLPYRFSYDQGRIDFALERARVSVADLALERDGLRAAVGAATSQVDLRVAGAPAALQVRVADASLALERISLAKGSDAPVQLAQAGVEGATVDVAARRVSLARLSAKGGRFDVRRERDGSVRLARWFQSPAAPRAPAAGAAAQEPAWSIEAPRIELGDFAFGIGDESSGVRVQVRDARLAIDGASTDLSRALKFDAAAKLAEGGQLSAKGTVQPASMAVSSDIDVRQLALKPVQPLLDQYVKLKIRSGFVNARGRVEAGGKAALRYDGSVGVHALALHELDDDLFASWREVSAARINLSVAPNRLDIPEIRVVGADAKLIIEDDRTFNAARLLVARPAAAPAPAPAASQPSSGDAFPVRVRRVRVQDARLEFTDLSLRPQFSAKIHELSGVVNGLASSGGARSQIELDGRVDEFGLARFRGELNPFQPRDNTDVRVVFRNVDMVPASPYSMKFAGYRIAEGKISLDLQYKVQGGKLEGDNRIVIDQLTLGERVESPDALKIPLQLAIAILKDSDGRIDLGLPVSGDLDDPQFSYGAIVWKAIGNVLTKIVTAPFRALGAMLGVNADKLEAITFDAGSGKLLPPEQEKLRQVAQVLAKRGGLKLLVPAAYGNTADGASLRMMAVRREIAQRAGFATPGEEPGPLDPGDGKVRKAMRELYAQRFGDAELDKAKRAAEGAPAASGTPSLKVWERVGKMVQGEPQVADAGAFYNTLRERLEREQPLPADALAKLGADRAQAIAAALAQAGVDPSRVTTSQPQAIDSTVGQPVALKLGLEAK